jgi:hypothetical protein
MEQGLAPGSSLPAAVEHVFHRARGRWIGCDWPTAFGETGLELNGLTSGQASLMARATSGLEASDWRAAVMWLRLIEVDADGAERAARRAVEHAARGDLGAALRHAKAAEELEARYHATPVWRGLVAIIECALNRPVGAV